MVVPYKHEPFTDFSIKENKDNMDQAIKEVEASLGGEYPLIINGERVTTDEKITSVNPANPNEIIGVVSKANKDIADKAMKVADETFESWIKSDPKARADILFRSAAIVRRRNLEFTAHLVIQGGKIGIDSCSEIINISFL